VYFYGNFLLRLQVKNETETGHTLYVKSSPVMHLVFTKHGTVTTQRGATNIVSYIQANRREWEVHVDRK
jgi:catechol-2,3-dioxygenase